MNPAYQKYKEFKQKDREAFVKKRSMKTLEWYEKIGMMLDDPTYEYCADFLTSVCTFIETKEYISDKQIEAIQNILDNTNYEGSAGQPF